MGKQTLTPTSQQLDAQGQEEQRMREAQDVFAHDAWMFKVDQMFPNLGEKNVEKTVEIIEGNLYRGKLKVAAHKKLEKFDLGPDRGAAIARIEQAAFDIGAALVGLGIDVDECGPESVIWSDDRARHSSRERTSRPRAPRKPPAGTTIH